MIRFADGVTGSRSGLEEASCSPATDACERCSRGQTAERTVDQSIKVKKVFKTGGLRLARLTHAADPPTNRSLCLSKLTYRRPVRITDPSLPVRDVIAQGCGNCEWVTGSGYDG